MNTHPSLLGPVEVGFRVLPNRVVMAPLTRMRAHMPGNIPWALNEEYYRQRSGAGLIISEGTPVSPTGHGYYGTPGIHTSEQVEGWKGVTRAVHGAGGRIFLQLWHVGRLSHTDLQPGGAPPLAPSAIAADGSAHTKDGPKPWSMPRALELEEIPRIVADFAHGAALAKEAGFDGVEIHGANGYLLEQFLSDRINLRDDIYGGSVENRARFFLDVVAAVTSVWGSEYVGVRISPSNTYGTVDHSDRHGTYAHLIGKLNVFHLAYLHIVEPRVAGNIDIDPLHDLGCSRFRPLVTGNTKVISAGGYTRESGDLAIAEGHADLVAYGRSFIANPDLVERFREGAPLNPYDRATFYGGTEKGYTDYPTLESFASRESHWSVA
ncbi:MAG: alkene reductase [Verrucomicrobia bacterium 61-8]|nr:alkene reductase [Verrucomicrobiota bacterium]OJV20955.1 MAG: alkene reductase [Verrucomicrobia bacterium 61-8]